MGVEWITGGMCETLMPVCDEAMDLCVLRIDEYMIHGDSLLVQMVDDGKLVCPAEEAEGMLGMFSPVDSRIPGDKHTPWSHIIVPFGHEYGLYCEFRDFVGGCRLESVLKNVGSRGLSRKALPPPEKEKAPPPRVIFQKSARPLFVAFSPSASTRYSKQLGTRVPCFGRKERGQLHKWLQARSEAEAEIRKAQEERDEKEENGEDVSKIPVPELPKPPPELEQLLSDSVYPVMILEAEDMPFEYTKDYGRCSIAMDYAQAVEDAGQGPGRSCAIAVGDFDSFAKNPSSVETLMKLTENYMPTIFTTDEELTKAAAIFTNPQHPQDLCSLA
ncbi:unnamed protein product [Symbiodinium sp. CCMP2592]|nr:unnamed protein product [Symbiodinium sp. CCMP2592]